MKRPHEEHVDALRDAIAGTVLQPHDSDYEQARKVWNGMIDRRPALIVRCGDTTDVPTALRFATQHGLDVAVRGAGHNIAGNAVCNDGLMIDLSALRAVEVDAKQRRASVQPGATLADVDAATQQHGLATPVGINSTTGIAGLTLGGGFGWLTRRYGMTVDNLLAADVVLADGSTCRASADENPELFWGLRGGGGNFGVVTRFEFQLHPVGPEILAGLVVYPFAQAAQVLRGYRRFAESAPESVTAWTIVRKAPPLPFLPESAHGSEVVVIAVACTAPPQQRDALVAPLLELGDPVGSHIGAMPYAQWQQAFDPLLTPGARNYWKSHNFTTLHDDVIDTMIEFGQKLPSAECEIFIGHIGGAPNRVAADAMAYAHRDARFVMNVHGRWQSAAEDAAGTAWAREVFAACAPYASAGAYINFLTADEAARTEAAFGANHGRLQQLKQQFDPNNVFHLNPNIVPTGQRGTVQRQSQATAGQGH
jgi:FAD/FMN-containing dehydrogenase